MTGHELAAVPVLSGLGESGRELLARRLELRELPEGGRLFAAGDPAEGLILVLSGALRVQAGDESGRFGPGETLGSLSLAAPGTRRVSAVADETTRVAVLSTEGFDALAGEAPAVAMALLRALFAELAAPLHAACDAHVSAS